MKKIYIHIGLHKTASSAIQKFMKDNEKEFLKKNIYIPQQACEFNYLSNHCNLVFEKLKNYSFKDCQLKSLLNEIKNQKIVLLSSETFEFLINKREIFLQILNEFRKLNYEIELICYTRNDKFYLSSRYVELLKSKKYNDDMLLPDFFTFFLLAFFKGSFEIKPLNWTCYFNNAYKKNLKNLNIKVNYLKYEDQKNNIISSFLKILNLNLNHFRVNNEIINASDKIKYKKFFSGMNYILSCIIFYKRKYF